MAMIDVIKRIAKEAVEAGSPVAFTYGTVTAVGPLEVLVDQRFSLPEELLVIPESLKEYKLDIGGVEYEIRKGLEAGDQLILVRMQGGQNYLIIDRV